MIMASKIADGSDGVFVFIMLDGDFHFPISSKGSLSITGKVSCSLLEILS